MYLRKGWSCGPVSVREVMSHDSIGGGWWMKVPFVHHFAPCNNRLLSCVLGLIGSQAFAWMNSPGKAKYCLIKERGMKPLKQSNDKCLAKAFTWAYKPSRPYNAGKSHMPCRRGTGPHLRVMVHDWITISKIGPHVSGIGKTGWVFSIPEITLRVLFMRQP